MHLLHTADWHLGHRLCNRERIEEHRVVLDAMLGALRERPVDLLLHAGDVFDHQSPGVPASRLYFDTLETICREGLARTVVIVPGNHDSAAWLAAPERLLRHRNVIVVGDAGTPSEERVVVVRDADGEPVGVVGAVPYLRMADLRVNLTVEMDGAERSRAIVEAMGRHYDAMAVALEPWRERGLPAVVTGHLFAAGVATSGSEQEIHVGNLGRVGADLFADRFDYVALGHIHRPQTVAARENIRYCGSPIPLDFGERRDAKCALRVDLSAAGAEPRIESMAMPAPRSLVAVEGDADELVAMMEREREQGKDHLRPWLRIVVHAEGVDPARDEKLRSHAERLGYQVLRIELVQRGSAAEESEPIGPTLRDLTPADLFAQVMEERGVPEEERELLRLTFLELETLVGEGAA